MKKYFNFIKKIIEEIKEEYIEIKYYIKTYNFTKWKADVCFFIYMYIIYNILAINYILILRYMVTYNYHFLCYIATDIIILLIIILLLSFGLKIRNKYITEKNKWY